MTCMLDEIRQTARALRRVPALSVVILVTFALGIGATTAIYSVVRHVLLKPLPYKAPDRLVQVWTQMPEAGIPKLAVASGEYLDYRAESQIMEEAGAYLMRPIILTGVGEPVKIVACLSTASLWRVLGVEPLIGRTLVDGDDTEGAERVVVLSHGMWQSRFGGDQSVLGRSIELSGRSSRVIGVMPPGFAFPRPDIDVWVPVVPDPTRRNNHGLAILARMKPGASYDQVQPEMDAIVERWATQFTHSHPFLAVPYEEEVFGAVRQPLILLLAVVGVVLLIAAVNVAGLLLARGEARSRELAVRSALGCGRGGLIRGLLGESMVLAIVGGVLGVTLAKAALTVFVAMEPGYLPRLNEITLDLPVLLCALGASLMAGLLAGLVPAWRASRPDLASTLRGAGEHTTAASARQHLRSAFVIGETALAVILVTAAALFLRGLWDLYRVDSGLKPDHVLTAQISLPSARYTDPQEVTVFYDGLVERARALPGVSSVALVNSLPMRDQIRMILVGGPWQTDDAEPIGADVVMVTPDFFKTLGNPIVRGREFTPADRPGAQRVAAVNETAARVLFGTREAVGQSLEMVQATPGGTPFEVVAVVRDVPTFGPAAEVRAQVYVPLHQALTEIRGLTRAVSIALRTDVDPMSLAPALRAAVWEADDQLAVSNLESMEQVVSASMQPQRYEASLIGLFAILALVLAAVGLYGLLAHVVGLRRHELGIRLAVGASPGQLWRQVLLRAMVLAGVGVVIGGTVSLLAGKLLSGMVYGLTGADLPSLAVTGTVLILSAATAAAIPARRAAAVDPAVTLRQE